MEFVFKRKKGLLGIPVASGTRWVPAYSRVRNEINGERPDPKQLPDIEHSFRQNRTVGEIVMPRPYPLGTFKIYGLEASSERWTGPMKILTDAHQPLPVWKLKPTGEYDCPTGEMIEDWCYWAHYGNGSYHTDGCIGIVNLIDLNTATLLIQDFLKNYKGIIQITAVDE